MPIALYMNQHIPQVTTTGLRLRGADVITAQEDGKSDLDDPELLDRAGELGRVLFTQDDDLLTEATKRQRKGIPFHGVIYLRVSIGTCVRDLEIVAKAGVREDLVNTVEFLPL